MKRGRRGFLQTAEFSRSEWADGAVGRSRYGPRDADWLRPQVRPRLLADASCRPEVDEQPGPPGETTATLIWNALYCGPVRSAGRLSIAHTSATRPARRRN